MQGGTYLFDQTYNVAFTDASITTTVAQAKSVLSGAGAISFTGPTQLSNNQTLVSSITNTVQTGSSVTAVTPIVTTYVGPQTIFVGPNQSQTFAIPPGGLDIDTLTTSNVTINQTATTTNTNLTTQVYEIVGVAQSVPQTPIPPSLLLALAGLACTSLIATTKWKRQSSNNI